MNVRPTGGHARFRCVVPAPRRPIERSTDGSVLLAGDGRTSHGELSCDWMRSAAGDVSACAGTIAFRATAIQETSESFGVRSVAAVDLALAVVAPVTADMGTGQVASEVLSRSTARCHSGSGALQPHDSVAAEPQESVR